MQISIFDSRLLCALFKELIEQRTDYAFFYGFAACLPREKDLCRETPGFTVFALSLLRRGPTGLLQDLPRLSSRTGTPVSLRAGLKGRLPETGRFSRSHGLTKLPRSLCPAAGCSSRLKEPWSSLLLFQGLRGPP